MILIVAIVFLGLFAAMFMVSIWIQRGGQRYLRNMHLRDIAERYAVVDHMDPADVSRLSGAQLDQSQLKSRMQAEIDSTRSYINLRRHDEEGDARDVEINAGAIANN